MTDNQLQSLAIVVPCYNEEAIFTISSKALTEIIEGLISSKKINIYIIGIKLSHNQGHQMALIAAMSNFYADMTVTIDADLQDDPNIINDNGLQMFTRVRYYLWC